MSTGRIELDRKAEPPSATATKAEIRDGALAHYEKVSSAAHEWHSAIPKAIEAYYAEPTERERLRDAVVETAKARRKAKLAAVGDAGDYIRSLHAAMLAEHAAVDALIEFESLQDQKD